MEEGKRTWEEWNSLWTFQLWLPDDRSEEHFIDRGDQLQDIKEKVQMHLLIHSYARKIGQSRLADLLAPVQFGLANKAELYWRRGCCKESLFIIIIIKERNNFEHFVCIYTKGREEKKIMERSQTLSLSIHVVELLCLLGQKTKRSTEKVCSEWKKLTSWMLQSLKKIRYQKFTFITVMHAYFPIKKIPKKTK